MSHLNQVPSLASIFELFNTTFWAGSLLSAFLEDYHSELDKEILNITEKEIKENSKVLI